MSLRLVLYEISNRYLLLDTFKCSKSTVKKLKKIMQKIMNALKEIFKKLKNDPDTIWMTKYHSIIWKMIGIQKIKMKNNKFCAMGKIHKTYVLILVLAIMFLSIFDCIHNFLPKVPTMSSSLLVTFVIKYWGCVLSICIIIICSSFLHTGKYIEMLKDINRIDDHLNFSQSNKQEIRLVIIISSSLYLLLKNFKIIRFIYLWELDPISIINYFGYTVLEFEMIHASIYIGFIAQRFQLLNLYLQDKSLRTLEDRVQFYTPPSIIMGIWESNMKVLKPQFHLKTENKASFLYKLLTSYDILTNVIDHFNSVFGFAVRNFNCFEYARL